MRELVFATYVATLKTAWENKISDEDIINFLCGSIVLPLALKDKKGEPLYIKKELASKIINRKEQVPQTVRKNSSNEKVLSGIDDYFATKITSYLLTEQVDDLIHTLATIIQEDTDIAPVKKQELLEKANKKTLTNFLASVFLYSITRINKLTKDKEEETPAKKQSEHDFRERPLPALDIPEDVSSFENKYVMALLEVYSQETGIAPFQIEALENFSKHKEHFAQQRSYYFSAEAVRRGIRDIYSEHGEDQFQVLMDETFDGIIDVWEDTHKNALTRLRKVMAQASIIRVDRCWLIRDTDWIGNSQKKGVCHFLINTDRIKGWVNDNDD